MNSHLQGNTVIYTRFSSDMQRTESCEDQERVVRKALDRLGIDHTDALVLRDEAQSGTKESREVYGQIVQRIRHGEKMLLAVDDQGRFSRGDYVKAMIRDLIYSGGRFISTGEGIDTDQPGWEIRVGIMEIHNSLTIADLGRRVRRGQEGRILDGCGSAGDFPYGYRSEFVDPSRSTHSGRGPKPKRKVVVHEPEAHWVRQVFAWFGDGWSISSIARELTSLNVDKRLKSSRPGWHHQQVRHMLSNTKYIGRWVWGRTRTMRNSAGKTKQVPVDASEVSQVARPELRIIDDETWRKVQKMLAELEAKFGKKNGHKRRGPKAHYTEVYPSSLLGGLLFCGSCGARLVYHLSNGNVYYFCPKHPGGMCGQATQVRREKAEKAILDFVGGVLTSSPEWLERAWVSLERELKVLSDRVPAELKAKQKRRDKLARKIEGLLEALEDNPGKSFSLARRLEGRDRELAALDADIATAKQLKSCIVSMPHRSRITERLRDLRAALTKDERRAALFLRRILGKVHAHEVIPPGKRRGYIQLRFSIDGWKLTEDVLEAAKAIPSAALDILDVGEHKSPEVRIDLGGPSRMDVWAPKIVEMRRRKPPVVWREIGKITGLGCANAYTAWKRYVKATETRSGNSLNEDAREEGAVSA